MGSTINWSPQVKELNLFSLPFLFPSYKALDAVEDGEPGQRLWKLIEAKGVIPLAWGENGFRDLTNSKRAVRTPQDLDRLKVRVVGSPIFMETFRALGAAAISAGSPPFTRIEIRRAVREMTGSPGSLDYLRSSLCHLCKEERPCLVSSTKTGQE
jgi:hypothetical protein